MQDAEKRSKRSSAKPPRPPPQKQTAQRALGSCCSGGSSRPGVFVLKGRRVPIAARAAPGGCPKSATWEQGSLPRGAPLAARRWLPLFASFVTSRLQLKGPLLHGEAAERQRRRCSTPLASFSREDVAVRPRLFCSSILGCCYSSSARRHPPGRCRRRRGRDPPHPPPLRSPDPHGSAVGSGRGRGGRGVAQRGRAACVQCLKATSSTWGTPGSCMSRGSALGGRTAPETTPPSAPHPPQLPAASPPSSFLLFPNSAAPFAAALHALTHLQPRSREDATSRRRFDVVKLDKRGRLRVSKGLWGPEAAGLSAEQRRPACVGLWEVPEGFCPAAAPTWPWVRLSPRRAACSPERRGERSPREQNSPKRVLKSERSRSSAHICIN